jgi:hypothetical protein
MINSVRNTVLAICNKNNYGYISPSDFNLFGQQAQMDMFEDYFYQYNYQINKVNAHTTGSSYANLAENLLEVIDSFSVYAALANVAANDFTLPADFYYINRLQFKNLDIEKVSESKLLNLTNSLLTAPTEEWPAYIVRGNTATIYPDTIAGAGVVFCQYIRYPLAPKWTYSTLTNGEPVFHPDIAGLGYQDFELPLSDEPMLTTKILQYAGISIRETEVVNTMNTMEANEKQQEQ